jgi:hypothetical protein
MTNIATTEPLQKMGLIPQDDPILESLNPSSLNQQLGKRGYQNVNFIDTLTARNPAMDPTFKKFKQDTRNSDDAVPEKSFPKIATAFRTSSNPRAGGSKQNTTGKNKVFRADSLPKLDGKTIASFRTSSSIRRKNPKQDNSSGGDAELANSFSKIAIRAKKNLIRKGTKDHSKQPNNIQSDNETCVDSSASNAMWVRQYNTRSSTRLQQTSEWGFLEEVEKNAPVADAPMNSEKVKKGKGGKDGVHEF